MGIKRCPCLTKLGSENVSVNYRGKSLSNPVWYAKSLGASRTRALMRTSRLSERSSVSRLYGFDHLDDSCCVFFLESLIYQCSLLASLHFGSVARMIAAPPIPAA